MALSILNLSGRPSIKIPRFLQSKEPTFVMRYWLVAEIISQLSNAKYQSKKIIDVGGNGSLLPEILNKKIDILDLPDNDYGNYIQASALAMPIKDSEYDIAVSCDVYEHIPENDREKFIDELLRISKEYVVLCGPMYKPETAEAEKRTNAFFKDLTGRDHPWLEEHISYTLPKEDLLVRTLEKKELNFVKFDHGSLLSWELITKLNLMMIERGVAEDEEVASKISKLNEGYVNKGGFKDFAEKGYRTIYIIQKRKEPLLKVVLPKPDPIILSATVLGATDILKQLTIKLHSKLTELDIALAAAHDYSEHNQILTSELSRIQSSPAWQVARIGHKVARPIVKMIRKTRLNVPIRKLVNVSVNIALKVPLVSRAMKLATLEIQRQNNQRKRRTEYQLWYQENQPRTAELREQKENANLFTTKPLISIILPTYNTNEQFLNDCIQSVLAQTYDRWELCIADDASTNSKIKKIIKDYGTSDSRIKYILREKNGHICEASNSALGIATGDFVALLDHDDILWPNALYEIVARLNQKPQTDFIYTDEDKIDEKGGTHSDPFFKPAWSPDYLRSINYITHFSVIRKELIERVGGFRKGYEGAQDWDLFLRVTRETDNIEHVSKILYSWRKSEDSTAMKPSAKKYAYANQKKVLIDDAAARGLTLKNLNWAVTNSIWKAEYEIQKNPKVSIIIPTKNKYTYISKCLRSIYKKSTYRNIEIILVDTGSSDSRVWRLYESFKKNSKDFKVVKWTKNFNFSLVCNYGAKHATGEYYLFLNNDTEVITNNWVELLLQHAQQSHVGAVGCKLLYPNNTLQHAGVVLGVGGNDTTPGVAAHLFPAYNDHPVQDYAQLLYAGSTRNFSAVTAACIMVSRDKFNKVHGFNGDFQIAWNDVDFCLKLVNEGWYNVYNPFVKLYHHESISVGRPGSTTRNLSVFSKEIELFGNKWGWDYIANDPYYSPHFRKDIANARLKPVN